MGQIAHINTPLAKVIHRSLTKLDAPVSAWQAATEKQREAATLKWRAVSMVQEQIDLGVYGSQSAAVDGLLLRAKAYPQAYAPLYIGRGNTLISRSTLLSHFTKAKGDVENLLTNHKGSKGKTYPWQSRALALYAHEPTAANYPDAGDVAYRLEQEGWGKIQARQVRTVLNRYSKGQTDFAPNRVGTHYHTQNIGKHVTRDTSDLPVGHVYTGDGHMCDVYIAHPSNGQSWRPELTVWQDMRSNYVVGWFISNAESAVTTLHSLAQAFDQHQHVPARLYVDKGSGFENKMISQGSTSFLERMGIASTFSLPGNAKGKGLIEGWWRWFEAKCGKQFETYCGHVRTDNALRNMKNKIKKGEIILPSLAEYETAIQEYIDWYNTTPQKRLGCSPETLWQTIVRVTPEASLAQMMRPQFEATVRRETIQYKNRHYHSPVLSHFTGQRVRIEVDLNNDSMIVVRDATGQFICNANLVERVKAVKGSVIADDEQRRLEAQIKRLDEKVKTKIEQARPVYDANDFLNDTLLFDGTHDAIDVTPSSDTITIEDFIHE